MPPTAFCWRCRSREIEWVDLPGTGNIYYVIAVVSLDGAEGARLITNIVGVDVDNVAIDMPVQVVFDDVTTSVTVPRFRPIGSSD